MFDYLVLHCNNQESRWSLYLYTPADLADLGAATGFTPDVSSCTNVLSYSYTNPEDEALCVGIRPAHLRACLPLGRNADLALDSDQHGKCNLQTRPRTHFRVP